MEEGGGGSVEVAGPSSRPSRTRDLRQQQQAQKQNRAEADNDDDEEDEDDEEGHEDEAALTSVSSRGRVRRMNPHVRRIFRE